MAGSAAFQGGELLNSLAAQQVRRTDITDVVEVKRRALEQFESQLAHVDYVRTLLGLNAYRSIYFQRGRGYAEAFYECTPQVYRDLFERLTRRR